MAVDIDTLLDLVERKAEVQYGGERISHREHAIQTAYLAEQAGSSPALIAACLLHDIGHLLHKEGLAPALRGIDSKHEVIGGKQLMDVLGPDVAYPIWLHVDAKRYLCATDRDYFGLLSPVSVRSLELQGGPFSEAEAEAFIAKPYAEDAAKLRRWDDQAKVPDLKTPPFAHFRRYVEEVRAAGPGAKSFSAPWGEKDLG